MKYLNKINNEFDILGIDISEKNKEFKSHGLGQKRRKKAHFDAKRIPVINKCKNKLERITAELRYVEVVGTQKNTST